MRFRISTTSDEELKGSYSIELQASLTDYPLVEMASVTISFKVDFEPITGFNPSSSIPDEYHEGDYVEMTF